jgi:hypothetical protein
VKLSNKPGRLWSKPSSVLSTYTGKHELEDATGRFHASLAFRREVFDRIGGWPLTKRGDFDQQLIARLHAIEVPGRTGGEDLRFANGFAPLLPSAGSTRYHRRWRRFFFEVSRQEFFPSRGEHPKTRRFPEQS